MFHINLKSYKRNKKNNLKKHFVPPESIDFINKTAYGTKVTRFLNNSQGKLKLNTMEIETIKRRKFSAYSIPGLEMVIAKHENRNGVTSRRIKLLVAEFYKVRASIKTRLREVVQLRQLAHFFSKKLTKDSLTTIGAEIGQVDHATVLHSCKTVNNIYETDVRYRNQVDELEQFIKKSI